jgi:hypothetical protein
MIACNSSRVSLLNNPSCPLPCWENINPGETTKNELLSIVANHPLIDKDTVTQVGYPWNIFDDTVYFTFGRSKINVEALILDNKVATLILTGDMGVTFGQLIEKTGDPEGVIILSSPDGGSFVIAVNHSNGVSFAYETSSLRGKYRSEISPEIPIRWLTLFNPKQFHDLLEAGIFSMGAYNADETLEIMHPWVGYGSIEEKYLSER